MKKEKINRPATPQDELLPEYDFTGKKGVRGKYYQRYRQGHTVRVQQPDGSVNLHHFTLADGAVMLEPDVREYFPDSEAVNTALRALIALVPTKRKAKSRTRQPGIRQTNQ
jgi:hypothetical protein